MIADALAYLQRGLTPIPIGPNKRPLVKWEPFQHEAPHADQVDAWWTEHPDANIGIVTGAVSGVVVLDADGDEGLASLVALETSALTWLSRTGRGWHQWFKHPGVKIGNRAGVRPHLDVRADGGYVIAPPSLHASGRRYEWLTPPDFLPLAPLPEHVLALLLTEPASAPGAAPAGEAIPSGQRNETLYRLARSLMLRLTPGAVHLAIAEENRTRCRPPLPDREVRDLVEHALTQPHGPDFKPPENEAPTPGATTTDGRPALLGMGLGTFLRTKFEPPEVFVDGLLTSEGSGWIGGEEKLGKSYYAIHEGLMIAMGLPVLGRYLVPQQQRVLFIEEEDPPRRVWLRVRAFLRGLGYDPDNSATQDELEKWFRVVVWEGVSLDEPAMLARVEETIREFSPRVVYVDVLRKVTTRDLNKANEAGQLLAALDRLRRTYGVVFRILHHFRKSQGFRTGRGSQEMGGSYQLGAWGECSLFFEPIGRKEGAVRVEVQTKDGAPVPAFRPVFYSEGPREAPTLVRLTAEEDQAGESVDDLIAQAVATLPSVPAAQGAPGVTREAIMAALKKSDSTVRRALKRLVDAGRVLEVGRLTKGTLLYGPVVE